MAHAGTGMMSDHTQLLAEAAQTRRDGNRTLVLWLGDAPPHRLTAACLQQGLTIQPVTREDMGRRAPRARGLVLPVPIEDGEFPVWGSRVLSEAMSHGLRVALVQEGQESELPQLEDEEQVSQFFAAVKMLRRDTSRVLACYRDWGNVVRWVHEHDAGPGANAELVIQGAAPEDSEAELLLRRAFHDLQSVSLEVLSGGKSGASVWRVRPGDADRARRPLPFIVKIHDREKMRAERSKGFIVRNSVEWRLCAPIHADRCVEGDQLGLVVYEVMDRAAPFRAALQAAPGALVGSLFGETLRGFRAGAATEVRPLVPEFERSRLRALRWSDPLREASALARAMKPAVPDVATLQRLLADLPAVRFISATAHGDLHAGNLLVPTNSSDVLMIDYGAILQNAPVVADPACLEVSLVFPPHEEWLTASPSRVTEEWRRAVYRYPLDSATVPWLGGADDWLPQAVRAIRAYARSTDPYSESYGIAAAAYLLRFASFDDSSPTEERALAYELACDIVTEVDRALRDDPRTNGRVA